MPESDGAPTFRCIYCGHHGPAADFDNEHVFSRSLCGTGANWTLVNRVCKACNNRFSRFETELLQQAAETVARGFCGPLGRSAKRADGTRIQPLKINHLYELNANDPLVYEAGFSFPSEFYFRPQMIAVGDGTVFSLVTERREIKPFEDAMSRFVREPKSITLPRPQGQREYEIALFEQGENGWHLTGCRFSRKPSDIFFREFIQRPTLPPMTARIAQNDDGKLFMRAATIDRIGEFIDLLFANRQAGPRPPLPPGPGNQTFFFGLQIDLIKVYKAIIKTGLNLVAHLYGDDVFRNGAFDEARRIVLDDQGTNDAAAICQMMPGFTADFPRAPTEAHQMMLDEYNGTLRFRIRLYNSFGYSATLAPMNNALRGMMGPTLPRRVLVEFQTTGIREVPDWN